MEENITVPNPPEIAKPMKLADIYNDVEGMAEEDWLIQMLNAEPKPEWVKTHPYIKVDTIINGIKQKVPYKYLNIDRIEYLLKKIFKRYRIEVLNVDSAFNGVYVTARIHYLHPIRGTWEYHDGVGAKDLQVKSGSTSADLSSLNNGAITMAIPMAKTFAIKNACSHFGRMFGSELNGPNDMDYSLDTLLQEKANVSKIAEINNLLSKQSEPVTEPLVNNPVPPPPPAQEFTENNDW